MDTLEQAELKVQNAQLKVQLIETQFNMLNLQYPQAKADLEKAIKERDVIMHVKADSSQEK